MILQDVLGPIHKPRKIAVCTAWGSPFSWTHAAYNMMNLIRPEGAEVKFLPGMGRDPARRHVWGVMKALAWGATHICFLGADQLHDLDILVKFAKHCENGWPMVTALVPIRGWVRSEGVDKPFMKVAWKLKPEVETQSIRELSMSAETLEMIDPSDGPYQKVAVVGSGAIMFDVDLLHNLKKPWFREADADDDAWRPASMDTTFVWRMCQEAGGRFLCDQTINVAHLDVFPIDESYPERFNDWPKEKAEKTLYWDL